MIPYVRVLLADELTSSLLEDRSLASSADRCWAFRAFEPTAIQQALADARWIRGDYPLFEGAEADLARWAFRLTDGAAPPSAAKRALLAYGLYTRLNIAAHARAVVGQVMKGEASRSIELEIVSSDPYLRGAFAGERATVMVRGFPGRSPRKAWLRDRFVRSRYARSGELALAGRLPRPARAQPPRTEKTVAFFVLDRARSDLTVPIRDELSRRGRPAVVIDYGQAPSGKGILELDRLSRSIQGPLRLLPGPALTMGDLQGPVPIDIARRAFLASWFTAEVQTEKLRRVLGAIRPSMVVSFGPDTITLALQSAAAEMGIPSLFLPHGLMISVPVTWSLPATATAVPGSGCVEVNAVNPLGERQTGLVMVGHPNFDELFHGATPPADLATLRIPETRPYRVLLFADWGFALFHHVMQQRLLEMTAKALPHDAFLICKLHPGREERERYENQLGALLPRDAFAVVGRAEFTTPALLRVSDVAVAIEESTALIDAAIAGVPPIGVRQPENPIGSGALAHPARQAREVREVAESVEELRRSIAGLIHDSRRRQRLLSTRRSYVERYFTAADGRSSARVVDLIEHLVAGGSPSSFVPQVAPGVWL